MNIPLVINVAELNKITPHLEYRTQNTLNIEMMLSEYQVEQLLNSILAEFTDEKLNSWLSKENLKLIEI